VKAKVPLLAVAIVLVSITLLPVGDARLGEEDISAAPGIFVYKEDGNWPMNHWANPDCTNITIYTNERAATIRVRVTMPSRVYVPAQFGDILNAGGSVKTVSYKASWENNKTINLFNGKSGSELNFNLTGIPYGYHSITISASCDVLLFDNGFSSTYPVFQSAEHQVVFTVARVPTPTRAPTPTPVPILSDLTLVQTVIAITIIIVFVVIAFAFYKRHRKHLNLNEY